MERVCEKCRLFGTICRQDENNRRVYFDGKMVLTTTEKIEDCPVSKGEMTYVEMFDKAADLANKKDEF
ncbi:MAG: hypothetical protein ABSC49_03040 [Candidatus Microgenomates bacterium]|jgi:hypothetical protein